jgi:hypothetical protein
VETKGKTLEEVDALFDGHMHSNAPDPEMVRRGKVTIDVQAVEMELNEEVMAFKTE